MIDRRAPPSLARRPLSPPVQTIGGASWSATPSGRNRPPGGAHCALA